MKVWGIEINEEYASKLTINQFENEFGRLFNNKPSMIVEAFEIIRSAKKVVTNVIDNIEPLIDLQHGTDTSIAKAAKEPESKKGKTRRNKNI